MIRSSMNDDKPVCITTTNSPPATSICILLGGVDCDTI